MSQIVLSHQLKTALSPWGNLKDESLHQLVNIFTPCNVQSGAHLIMPGEAFERIIVVVNGLLRFYVTDEDGNEWNKNFLFEHSISGPLAEHSEPWPGFYGLQALEDCTVLLAPVNQFRNLVNNDVNLDQTIRHYVSALLQRKANRLTGFQRLNATGRYLEFCKEYSAVIRRIPQYHIASFLGISEVSLSRLRSQLTK